MRLHEKGGKEHELPCHHNLEEYLDAYIAACRHRRRSGRTAIPHDRAARPAKQPMWQQDVYRMIQRRAKAAGIKTRIGNHTFRATCITCATTAG